ncbi:hypothetical protein [Conexibacter woesei]|uniref:hypothetical protein n=1 Tax=Conexibacter woesei TaxID=191495 RepID=UPI0011D1DAB6|nr:hypothetical protein [Conexibacter woesei]
MRRSPIVVAALLVAVLALAGGGVLLLAREPAGADGGGARDAAGTTAGAAPAPVRAASVGEVRALMEQRMRDRHLNFRYVACVRNGRVFDGVPVTRCNVNFNAPHIEVYCAVARGDTVATDHEDRAIPCPRDSVGRDPPIKFSGG